jgi:hypothetical protein
MWWRKSSYKITKTKVFGHDFNKTRQTLSDVILQEGDGVAVIPTLAKKITSELAEVRIIVPGDAPNIWTKATWLHVLGRRFYTQRKNC